MSGPGLHGRIGPGPAPSTATGDVTGPGASTDNAIARFDGVTGKVLQDSGVLIDDADLITAPNGITASGGNIAAAAGQFFQWTSRSLMSSPSDGNILFTNLAAADFGRLQFGGTTVAFPSLKRSGAALIVQLADDSDEAELHVAALRRGDADSGIVPAADGRTWDFFRDSTLQFRIGSRVDCTSPIGLGAGAAAPTSFIHEDGAISMVLADVGKTDFNLLKFGGTTVAFPALKRSAAGMHCRLADDSGFAEFTAGSFVAGSCVINQTVGRIQAPTDFAVTNSALIKAPSDGVVQLLDWTTGTTFGRLQFGGATASFPSLKRSSAELHCRLADDSADAIFQASAFHVAGLQILTSQQVIQVILTDNSGGVDTHSLTAIGDTSTSNEGPTLNGNFAAIAADLTELRSVLATHGIWA